MYGYQSTQSGGAMTVLCTFVGLLLIGALVAGVYLGGSELLSPSVHAAKASKLEAEADALRAQTAYEESQRQLALNIAEQKAAAELESLEARQAVLLKLMQPLVIAATVVGSIAVLTLAVAISYHLVAQLKGTRLQSASTKGQAKHHATDLPSRSEAKAVVMSEEGTLTSCVERARVRPDDVTYDGFLAYCHDYLLHPNRGRVFYQTEVASEVKDLYLAILAETETIRWESGGRAGWILPLSIRNVEDVRRRVSPRVFYGFLSTGQALDTVEPVLFQEVEFRQESTPTFFSS